MTATQYAKNCNKCGQPILMKQSGGKWAAFEADGLNTHACGQNSKPANQFKPVSIFTPEQETEIKRLAVEAVRAKIMEAKN
jgi:hypothetical protein